AKLFSGASTEFGAEPNTHVSLVDAAMPGMLPVPNAECIRQAVRTGLALDAKINRWSRFDRKNYFYADLPQGYQISQLYHPLVGEGAIEISLDEKNPDGEVKRIGIERIHVEQDAGKLMHDQHPTMSYVDLNRSGVALMEIVSRPDMRSPAEAGAYVRKLRSILRYVGSCDGNMEEGSMRADVNVSVRKPGAEFGTRTETKNVNSLRSIERAVRYEITRQAAVLDGGGRITQETRHWHEDTGVTTAGRSKETAEDYRYFPEPDLVPIAPSREWVEQLRSTLPEAPDVRLKRLSADWGFTDLELRDVVNAGAVDLIEATVSAGASPQAARKWWLTEIARRANETGVELESAGISPAQVAEIQALVDAGTINDKLARQVFDGVLAGEGTPAEVVAARGLAVVSDEGALGEAVDAAIAANPDVAEKIRAGKVQAAGALIGAVMKAMRGQADAGRVRELILSRLA
ncbi:MAG TPA: Asp-tRNA(Asn)/Glu-tRNA(Gln) amidotransferase subunit GatB, partial [Propionibacteriaceae bacterium]|nr:Asp-tRNA(Asn)/Glu-tRNA(Gln) amidotransferase subunit GatB [Propionibacteriaceae bacterium]